MTVPGVSDTEHAEVLIIGAGASGGVAALRLTEAGFRVLCLEQGEWPDPSAYPVHRPTFELESRGPWSPDPNVRRMPQDYPVEGGRSAITPLMYSSVGGSTIHYAGDWARMLPSDFRVRTLDGVADDWPLTYAELRPYYQPPIASSAFRASRATPRTRPAQGRRCHPCRRRRRPACGARPQPARLALVAGAERHTLGAVRRPRAVRAARRLPGGCPARSKASTDLTHWPAAIRGGGRVRTGTRSRGSTSAPPAGDGVEYVDRDGRTEPSAADVVILAANAIGTPRLLLNPPARASRTGSPTPAASSDGG